MKLLIGGDRGCSWQFAETASSSNNPAFSVTERMVVYNDQDHNLPDILRRLLR